MNIQAAVYNALRRALSQEQRGRIKRSQHRLRNKLRWYRRVRYGTFSADELREEIAGRIGSDFEVLMVHSAFDAMTPMYQGSVLDLKNALIDLCGPGRTLVMPAFVFGGPDFDAVRYYRDKPVFDKRKTPSQMGLLTELFRRHPGVLRSLHPTHSVCALGPLAEEMTARHHLDTFGCGPDSPFAVMDHRRTIILGIGVPYYRCLTQVHHIEHVLDGEFPAPCREKSAPVELRDGDKSVDYCLRVKVFVGQRKIERLERFLSRRDMAVWRFHGVPMFAVTAAKVTSALREQANKGVTIYTV
jgi:aminoglycoside N3'-acetyltransferase